MFQSKTSSEPKFDIFGLGPWAMIHGIAKLANTFISQIRSLMTPFERSFSELSENHKIFDIGSTESSYSSYSFSCLNLNSVDPFNDFLKA